MRGTLKVYELAAELGVKPRVVVEAARSMGIAVQNRLTRLDAASIAKLRVHLQQSGGDVSAE